MEGTARQEVELLKDDALLDHVDEDLAMSMPCIEVAENNNRHVTLGSSSGPTCSSWRDTPKRLAKRSCRGELRPRVGLREDDKEQAMEGARVMSNTPEQGEDITVKRMTERYFEKFEKFCGSEETAESPREKRMLRVASALQYAQEMQAKIDKEKQAIDIYLRKLGERDRVNNHAKNKPDRSLKGPRTFGRHE